LKYFVAKKLVFENRNRTYILVFEYRQRKKPAFAAQKTINAKKRPPGETQQSKSSKATICLQKKGRWENPAARLELR